MSYAQAIALGMGRNDSMGTVSALRRHGWQGLRTLEFSDEQNLLMRGLGLS